LTENLKDLVGKEIVAIDDLLFAVINKISPFNNCKIVKDERLRVSLNYIFVSGHFMQSWFSSKLERMQEAGLIHYYIKRYIDYNYLELIPEPDEPRVLTLEQLSIGFYVFVLFSCLALIVFVFEVFHFKYKVIRDMSKVLPFIN